MKTAWVVSVCVMLALLAAPANAARLLVPAYFYPHPSPAGSAWDELTAAAATTPITAIVNPASGAGTASNRDYVRAIEAFRRAGGQVVGYVPTAYGARDAHAVQAEVDRYADFYSVDGFFVDEMSEHLSDLAYYRDIHDQIKARNPAYRVFGNPGTHVPEPYLDAADTLVVFEGPSRAQRGMPFGYDAYGAPADWMRRHAPERFGALIHGVASPDEMRRLLALAQTRHTAYVFVTDDGLPNPWDALPGYWEAERAAFAVPAPTTGWLATLGLGCLAFVRRRLRTPARA